MGNISGCCERSKVDQEPIQKKDTRFSLLYTYSGDKKKEIAENEDEEKNNETFDIIINEVEHLNKRQSTLTQQEELDLVKAFTIDTRHFVKFQETHSFNLKYKITRTIGQGGFGKVVEVKHRESGDVRAAKFIKIMAVSDFEAVENEILILKDLDHPNILKIYEYFRQGTTIILVTDFIEGGSLFDNILKDEHMKFSEYIIAEIMRQLLSALTYMHKRNIIHSDIKPENLMLEKDPDGTKFVIKLIDFGISRILTPQAKQEYYQAGTVRNGFNQYGYMAPEQEKGFAELKSDVWGTGVMCYILLTGQHPVEDEKGEPKPLQFPDSLWSSISPLAVDFVKKMLVEDVEERISAAKALVHPWLQKNKELSIGTQRFLKGVMVNNLKNFKAKNDLQMAVLSYIAFNFQSEETKQVLKTAFDVLDENDNGEISYDQIFKGMSRVRIVFIAMGQSQEYARENADRIMARIDTNKNGYIDYTEFITANLNDIEVQNTERLRLCFNAMDYDRDGYLDLQEMKGFLFPGKRSWNPDQQRRAERVLLKAQDANNDGKISFDEFMLLMQDYHTEFDDN